MVCTSADAKDLGKEVGKGQEIGIPKPAEEKLPHQQAPRRRHATRVGGRGAEVLAMDQVTSQGM